MHAFELRVRIEKLCCIKMTLQAHTTKHTFLLIIGLNLILIICYLDRSAVLAARLHSEIILSVDASLTRELTRLVMSMNFGAIIGGTSLSWILECPNLNYP